MTISTVLYCEGGREGARAGQWGPAPGDRLDEAQLGAAHVFSRRAIARAAGAPETAVLFEAPLLTRGRAPRGSDLLHCPTLKRLTTGPWRFRRPNVVIVLVDADGEAHRARRLDECIATRRLPLPPIAIGVAVQEFEAWLLADARVVSDVLGGAQVPTSAPEALSPGGAKSAWSDLVAKRFPAVEDRRDAAKSVARACGLDIVEKQCASFAEFTRRIVAATAGGA